MYKPVSFITEVPYKEFSVYYLFYRPNKTLLPIEIENCSQNEIIPSIYNSLKRVIKLLNCSITRICIYCYFHSIFYTYMTVRKGKSTFDINIGFRDGIEIAREFSIPIYVNEKIVEKYGIRITKDLILKSLGTK